MTTELQNKAWACLPREFREEVKNQYRDGFNDDRKAIGRLFGIDNLLSDAEGEEMLTISRKEVQEQYRMYRNWGMIKRLDALMRLFGSKCLPDEGQPKKKDCDNPLADKKGCRWRNDGKCTFDSACYFEPLNPQEPKFKKGEMVRYHYDSKLYIVECKTGKYHYALRQHDGDIMMHDVLESDLEPYTEPKEESPQMKPIESKVSVYLATKEEDEEFRMLLYENGFQWNSGASLKGCSFWKNNVRESKLLYVYPDMTVTHGGNKTSDTLTFSEFKKQYFGENVNLSQSSSNCNKHSNNTLRDTQNAEIDHFVVKDEMVDNIIKRGFKNHNRLHIAAMMMQGMLSNTTRFSSYEISDLVRISLNCADALLREAEKGGSK